MHRPRLHVVYTVFAALVGLFLTFSADAESPPRDRLRGGTFRGLTLRGIGPALMSGRIADINDYVSGGTGPHYYQEIEASPADPRRVYQMECLDSHHGGRWTRPRRFTT